MVRTPRAASGGVVNSTSMTIEKPISSKPGTKAVHTQTMWPLHHSHSWALCLDIPRRARSSQGELEKGLDGQHERFHISLGFLNEVTNGEYLRPILGSPERRPSVVNLVLLSLKLY